MVSGAHVQDFQTAPRPLSDVPCDDGLHLSLF
jgi:hypothetical protein